MCCFVLLTRGWRRLETRPPVALGSSPELFTLRRVCDGASWSFSLCLSRSVFDFSTFLWDRTSNFFILLWILYPNLLHVARNWTAFCPFWRDQTLIFAMFGDWRLIYFFSEIFFSILFRDFSSNFFVFFEIGHVLFSCLVRSEIKFALFSEIWHQFFSSFFEIASCSTILQRSGTFFHHWWDETSRQSEIGQWTNEVRSQNEEISRADLKNGGKSRGKKGSLKSRREKRVYTNPWGLWSDPYGARRCRGKKPSTGRAPLCRYQRITKHHDAKSPYPPDTSGTKKLMLRSEGLS